MWLDDNLLRKKWEDDNLLRYKCKQLTEKQALKLGEK